MGREVVEREKREIPRSISPIRQRRNLSRVLRQRERRRRGEGENSRVEVLERRCGIFDGAVNIPRRDLAVARLVPQLGDEPQSLKLPLLVLLLLLIESKLLPPNERLGQLLPGLVDVSRIGAEELLQDEEGRERGWGGGGEADAPDLGVGGGGEEGGELGVEEEERVRGLKRRPWEKSWNALASKQRYRKEGEERETLPRRSKHGEKVRVTKVEDYRLSSTSSMYVNDEGSYGVCERRGEGRGEKGSNDNCCGYQR